MKKNKNNNRSFGILFFIVFSIVAIWPILYGGELRLWSFIIAIIFLIMGIMKSRFLTPLNILWIKFGELLGVIIAPVIMGLVYFLLIVSCHFFSRSSPLSPIFFHSSKISCGISNGLLFHLSFFRTKIISSSPKGDP